VAVGGDRQSQPMRRDRGHTAASPCRQPHTIHTPTPAMSNTITVPKALGAGGGPALPVPVVVRPGMVVVWRKATPRPAERCGAPAMRAEGQPRAPDTERHRGAARAEVQAHARQHEDTAR
jgi:hypothetical protein